MFCACATLLVRILDFVGYGAAEAAAGVDDAPRPRGAARRSRPGSGTPWISWRSSQTLPTDRAAIVSSARSASVRAVALRRAGAGEYAVGVEVAGALAADGVGRVSSRAARASRDWLVQPKPRQ